MAAPGMIPHRRPAWRWWVGLLLCLVSCQQPTPAAPPPPPTPTLPAISLHVGVTDSAASFIELITPAYAAHTHLAELALITGNDDALFADLDQGALAAILVHTIPENRADWFNPIAVDGLTLLVHPDNPISDLTLNQVQDIFSGRVIAWGSEPIQLLSREAGAGARTLFQARIMAEQRVAITALIAADDAAVRQAIAAAPNSMGYSMMGESGGDAGIRILTIGGISPTPSTTANQTYPLSAPLYFVTLAEPQGELRAFLAWLHSDAGQNLLGEKYGRVR